mgnify:FL=1
MAAKYGVDMRKVHVREGAAMIYFDRGYAAGMSAAAWADLSALWRFGREQGLFGDHLFNKLQK